MPFFGITVSFIIQKMKTKQIVYLSFLWWQVFFEGMGENILHIFQVSGQKMLTFTTGKDQTKCKHNLWKLPYLISLKDKFSKELI